MPRAVFRHVLVLQHEVTSGSRHSFMGGNSGAVAAPAHLGYTYQSLKLTKPSGLVPRQLATVRGSTEAPQLPWHLHQGRALEIPCLDCCGGWRASFTPCRALI